MSDQPDTPDWPGLGITHLGALSPAAKAAAAKSIAGTQAVAARLGPAGHQMAAFGDSSFVHAMHITTLISAAITLAGAAVVMIWMPARPGPGHRRPPGRPRPAPPSR